MLAINVFAELTNTYFSYKSDILTFLRSLIRGFKGSTQYILTIWCSVNPLNLEVRSESLNITCQTSKTLPHIIYGPNGKCPLMIM